MDARPPALLAHRCASLPASRALATQVVSIRPDVGDTWFVTLDDETDAMKTLEFLRSQTFKGKSVKARLKSENIIRTLLAAAPATDAAATAAAAPMFGGFAYRTCSPHPRARTAACAAVPHRSLRGVPRACSWWHGALRAARVRVWWAHVSGRHGWGVCQWV